MTKRHLKAFAALIREKMADYEIGERFPQEEIQQAEFAAHVITTVAAQDNPHFDREQFMRACGL